MAAASVGQLSSCRGAGGWTDELTAPAANFPRGAGERYPVAGHVIGLVAQHLLDDGAAGCGCLLHKLSPSPVCSGKAYNVMRDACPTTNFVGIRGRRVS